MTKTELLQRLVELDVPRDAFELDGLVRDECYVLDQKYGTWSVYYSERGLRTGEREFSSESDACEYLLRLLRRDFSV